MIDEKCFYEMNRFWCKYKKVFLHWYQYCEQKYGLKCMVQMYGLKCMDYAVFIPKWMIFEDLVPSWVSIR